MRRFAQCLTVVAVWCVVTIIISPINATKNDTSVAIANVSGTNPGTNATANNTAVDSGAVVYTYSEAIVKDGKPSVSQLTIAKGKDGKLHFAKTENGTTRTGVWEGPLPATPDVSQLVSDISDITKDMANPLADLSKGIGTSLQDYLQNASLF